MVKPEKMLVLIKDYEKDTILSHTNYTDNERDLYELYEEYCNSDQQFWILNTKDVKKLQKQLTNHNKTKATREELSKGGTFGIQTKTNKED